MSAYKIQTSGDYSEESIQVLDKLWLQDLWYRSGRTVPFTIKMFPCMSCTMIGSVTSRTEVPLFAMKVGGGM